MQEIAAAVSSHLRQCLMWLFPLAKAASRTALMLMDLSGGGAYSIMAFLRHTA